MTTPENRKLKNCRHRKTTHFSLRLVNHAELRLSIFSFVVSTFPFSALFRRNNILTLLNAAGDRYTRGIMQVEIVEQLEKNESEHVSIKLGEGGHHFEVDVFRMLEKAFEKPPTRADISKLRDSHGETSCEA